MPRDRAIEDIYRLTEVQESLLVHHLQRGQEDSGFLQMQALLTGDLHRARFESAWTAAVQRHPVLRSSIHWEDVPHPVQVVAATVPLRIEFLDWTALPPAEQTGRLREYLENDRRRALDLSVPPLSRLAVAAIGPRHHRLLWTTHHVLLDGWSSALVLREVMARYAASAPDSPLELPPAGARFRDYVRWARSRDTSAAAAFWRSLPLRRPCLVAEGREPGGSVPTRRRSVGVSLPDSARVEAWARANRVAPASLYVGSWALVLSEDTGSREPVFGLTVSGRTAELPGIESTVGMLANTLPMPLSVEEDRPVGAWIRDAARLQNRLLGFAHCSQGRIMSWAGRTGHGALFDTLLVVANFEGADALGTALAAPAADGALDLELRDFQGGLTSAYPLTVVLEPGPRGRATAHFDQDRLDGARVERLLSRLVEVADEALREPRRPVATLLGREDDPARLDTSSGVSIGATERVPAGAPALRVPTIGPRPLVGAPAPPTTARAQAEPANAPATPIEAHLMRLWIQLLDLPDVRSDDNFFDVGGHSLSLPRLIEQVRRDFGVALPLGVIFRDPTIRSLSRYIESNEDGEGWASLVAIRPEGSRPPLYLVHGLGGEIGYFYNLAGYLGTDQPLWALQSPPEPSRDIGEIASRYLEEVRARQPKGPYMLGGYCVGGCIAFEMARHLEGAGEVVELLAMVDSVAPSAVVTGTPRAPGASPSRLERVLAEDPRRTLRGLARRVRRLGAGKKRPRTLSPRIPAAFRQTASRHLEAIDRYAPGVIGADTWLFRTHDARFRDDLGWSDHIEGRFRIEWLDAPHADVLQEPYLAESGPRLAAVLSARLGEPEPVA